MRLAAVTLVLILGIASTSTVFASDVQPRLFPAVAELDSPEAVQQLLLVAKTGARTLDLTRNAKYVSADPTVATVSSQGQVRPLKDGQTEIEAHWQGRIFRSMVRVTGIAKPRPVSFRHQVVPILSKAGCNSGGCHGKAEGQNGFKLSVFGFDPDEDHSTITKQGRGRRLSPASPEQSLLLRKATGQTPHGGGSKVDDGGLWYRRLRRWVAEGARLDGKQEAARVERIEVFPSEVLLDAEAKQQLQVTAVDSTGRKYCVTAESDFQSNADNIADVDRAGLISVSDVAGEAAILVRYMGQVAVCRVTLPQRGPEFKRPPETNFIDGLVWNKLQRLGITPSELSGDAEFLRRVYLDTIGTLPTVVEAESFLDDQRADKRTRLIQQLLQRDEYADYWALRWADLLRMDKNIVTPQGTLAATRWLRKQFANNRPYDEFVGEILTVRGNTLSESPAAFYHVHDQPEEMGRAISQLFLGVRIECAQCHHHPFERWGQQDYFAFAGLFTGVSTTNATTGGKKIITKVGQDLSHPRDKRPVPAAGLGAAPLNLEGVKDRRTKLAEWMTAADNPFFARMIANRIWAHYFGRGLVEPIDDMRATNPATNEPLLDALAKHVIDVNFDLKAFTSTLLESRTYQLSSRPNASNRRDDQNFSRAAWKPLPAEVLLDAISQSTESPEEFNGWPAGYRAIQVWDNRMPSYFFRIFGRPERVSVCECERGNQPSVAQALHLMNSPESVRKIRRRDGRAARLANAQRTPEQIINELYLCTLSRRPNSEELALMTLAYEQSATRRAATEDVLWALLNMREFVFNH